MPIGLKQVFIAITPLRLGSGYTYIGTSWVVFPSHRNKVNIVVEIESSASCRSCIEALQELESHRSLITPASRFGYT